MKKIIIYIILFTFIQGIMHNIGHPVTPAFVRSLGIDDYMFGVFFAAMSFGLMIGGPLWGVLSDRGNHKRYILIGIILYSIGQLGFGYVHHPILMVIFRFISGFGAVAAITLLTALLIEHSKPEKRAQNLAYMGAAFTLGASLGYGIGGFISTNPWITELLKTDQYERIFLVQSIGNTLYGLLVFIRLNIPEATYQRQKASVLEGLKSLTKIDASLLVFFIAIMLMNIAAINLSKYIDVYFDTLGYNPQTLGTYVMVTGFVSLFASLFLVAHFAKLKKQLLTIGIINLLSAVIVFYVFRASNFLLVMYTVYMIYVIFKAIFVPLEQNYIAKYVKEGGYGGIMGLRQSFISIGMVIGPLVGGFIYEVSPLLLFDSSGISFILCVMLLGVVYKLEKNKKVSEV